MIQKQLISVNNSPSQVSTEDFDGLKSLPPIQAAGGEYAQWMRWSLGNRRSMYVPRHEPGLLSFVTSAYNTPLEFLSVLADSVRAQDFGSDGAFEWVVVDNGSTDVSVKEYLSKLSELSFVRYIRVEDNLGIIGGMAQGVRWARGRYILPLDSDDYIYPDCARIVASWIQQSNYPALLYSDEDKLEGSELVEPYLKPDWDPVLFVNSCYIAHLCAIDRGLAIMLGCYTDPKSSGCHDWDTFIRFVIAGYEPVHISEVLYSWRKHPQSCAANIDSKSYIHTSHQNALQKFLNAQQHPELYYLEGSPLFNGTPDWWIRRHHRNAKRLVTVVLDAQEQRIDGRYSSGDYVPHRVCGLDPYATVADLESLIRAEVTDSGLVALIDGELRMLHTEWAWEALTVSELFPDVVMVGGPVYDLSGTVVSAGVYFGYGSGIDTPDRLRSRHDPGYFAQMWKQHSVSAVSCRNCVVDGAFLLDALTSYCIPHDTALSDLGPWLGWIGLRWNRRIVYSPFMAAESARNGPERQPGQPFSTAHRESMPDRRYYSKHLDFSGSRPYQPQVPAT
jgi:O-antigen biosynthesis protein